MSNMRRFLATNILLMVGLCGWGASVLCAQEPDDEGQRQIFADEFTNTRPGGPRRSPRTASAPRSKPADNKSTENNQTQASTMLGITFWRLRPAAANDDTQARFLEQESDSESILVGERVNSDTKFKEGQKVRLSIESPRTGYLYVIDREQYADGTYSDPYLIFPTLKTRSGDNAVTAGRLIEIPDQDDRPPYFKMNRHRADQTGEVLTIMVMSQPLPNLKLERKALKLTNEQFAQWQQKFNAAVKRVDLANHAGKTYTKTEKDAGASDKTLLKPNDPPPQTIYLITTKLGEALMINVTLQYETATSPKTN